MPSTPPLVRPSGAVPGTKTVPEDVELEADLFAEDRELSLTLRDSSSLDGAKAARLAALYFPEDHDEGDGPEGDEDEEGSAPVGEGSQLDTHPLWS